MPRPCMKRCRVRSTATATNPYCATTWCRYAGGDPRHGRRRGRATQIYGTPTSRADAVLVILELLRPRRRPLRFTGWRRRDNGRGAANPMRAPCPCMRCIDSTTGTSRQSCRSRRPAPTPRSSSTNWCRRPSSQKFKARGVQPD